MNAKTAEQGMTYKGSGIDYEGMDPLKRAAQEMAARTHGNTSRLNIFGLEETRGESVYLFRDVGGNVWGHVEEGLGTKNLVAEAMYKATTLAQYYWGISQDTVAMIVNDMATLGISPTMCAMHLAAGHSNWFKDKKRYQALIHGWKQACDMAGCVWSGGETPTLKGIVMPETFVLSGSAVGIKKKRDHYMGPEEVKSGDAIIFLTSSGAHANGYTLMREIGDRLPQRYLTPMPNGRTYGDALLEPTPIYCAFVEICIEAKINLHYAVNVTGHGWRKLMRSPKHLTYVIETMPLVPPVLEFVCKQGPVDDEEAYGTFNMGAGFALYVSQDDVKWVMDLAKGLKPFSAMYAGHVKGGKRRVVIKPKGIMYEAESLNIR